MSATITTPAPAPHTRVEDLVAIVTGVAMVSVGVALVAASQLYFRFHGDRALAAGDSSAGSNATPAISTPPLPIDFICQQPHRKRVKVGTIIVQYRTIVASQQIGGFSWTIGFQQGRLHLPVGPAPIERLETVGAPFGHRTPTAQP